MTKRRQGNLEENENGKKNRVNPDLDKTLSVGKSVTSKATISSSSSSSSCSKWVGAHVSAAKGLQNAIFNSVRIGGNAFALFLKSQRKWVSAPLDPKVIEAFKKAMKEHGFSAKQVLPHGSYLINLGNPDEEKRNKSYDAFLDDLKRCELLDLEMYNFHPGSTVGECSKEESIKHIADCINKAHSETEYCTIVLENMAGQGNVIGSKFQELGDIIQLIKDKNRIGVCLDTCHMFAAGYDIRTGDLWNAVMDDFDKCVGLKYLKAMHLNDSMGDLGCGKDRHENLGKGKIGLAAFEAIMKDDRLVEIPLVLETPISDPSKEDEIYSGEIQLLRKYET